MRHTDDMTPTTTTQAYTLYLLHLEHERNQLEQAAAGFDPLRIWSPDWDAAIDRAGRRFVLVKILNRAGDGSTLEDIMAEAEEEVLRGAQYPVRSSSPTAGVLHQATTAAWADQLLRMRALHNTATETTR